MFLTINNCYYVNAIYAFLDLYVNPAGRDGKED